MEYKSNPDRIQKYTKGGSLSKEKRDSIEAMTKEGKSVEFIAEKMGVKPDTIQGAMQVISDQKGLDVASWKKEMSQNLANTATRLAQRLDDNIDSLPIGQIPLAIAILVDKVQVLQDAPTVVVEHRLRVSHDDINAMIRGDVIEAKEVKQSDLTE